MTSDRPFVVAVFVLTVAAMLSTLTPIANSRFEPTVVPKQTIRGTVPQRPDTAWEGQLIEIQRKEETTMASLVWMQAVEPIKITGELPLWGVLCAIGAGIAAIAALKVGLSSHEKLDQVRMEGIGEQIDALRDEMHEAIRTLMR